MVSGVLLTPSPMDLSCYLLSVVAPERWVAAAVGGPTTDRLPQFPDSHCRQYYCPCFGCPAEGQDPAGGGGGGGGTASLKVGTHCQTATPVLQGSPPLSFL